MTAVLNSYQFLVLPGHFILVVIYCTVITHHLYRASLEICDTTTKPQLKILPDSPLKPCLLALAAVWRCWGLSGQHQPNTQLWTAPLRRYRVAGGPGRHLLQWLPRQWHQEVGPGPQRPATGNACLQGGQPLTTVHTWGRRVDVYI